ncbi:MAG: hypothetical protein Q9190_005479 [Brigantiaea leucoxantha]
MTRTLPWLKDGGKPSQLSRTRPSKRPSAAAPEEDSSDDLDATRRSLAQKRAANYRASMIFSPERASSSVDTTTGRSPSTSPPPEPPTVEYMHEGLDRDDIYIMVEDEFLSVARTFTAHLHHAEYIRQKNLARARNRTINTTPLSRPTDSITTMREETKKKKEAEARAAKNKTVLKQTKASKISWSDKDEPSSDDEDSDEKHSAPWVGTSIAGNPIIHESRKGVLEAG